MSLDAFFKTLNAHQEQNLPFVCFTTKNGLKAYLQKTTEIYELEHYEASGFVFVPFSDAHPSILFSFEDCDTLEYEGELPQDYFNTKANTRCEAVTTIESTVDKQQHEALVSKAISTIKTTPLQKVICSRVIKVNTQVNLTATFKKLTVRYPDAFCYYWHHPEVGTWLGATPEQLIHFSRNTLKTVALAGTQHKDEFPEANWTSKELNEQKMVTNYILESLRGYSSDLEVGDVETVSAGNLWHLKTKINAKIDPRDLAKVVRTLHPTSAVCGLPKKEAKAFIQKNELYDRAYYSGFLGELNVKDQKTRSQRQQNQENQVFLSIKTSSDLYVNLRCMQVFEDSLQLYVGGGITEDSNPTDEYLETKAKSQTLLNVI